MDLRDNRIKTYFLGVDLLESSYNPKLQRNWGTFHHLVIVKAKEMLVFSGTKLLNWFHWCNISKDSWYSTSTLPEETANHTAQVSSFNIDKRCSSGKYSGSSSFFFTHVPSGKYYQSAWLQISLYADDTQLYISDCIFKFPLRFFMCILKICIKAGRWKHSVYTPDLGVVDIK